MKEMKVPYKKFGYFVGLYDGYKCFICGEITYKREMYKIMTEELNDIISINSTLNLAVELMPKLAYQIGSPKPVGNMWNQIIGLSGNLETLEGASPTSFPSIEIKQ
ncbi:MAG: hypothetical protein QW292_09285 [Candidatus Parvarchaeota archaeon]